MHISKLDPFAPPPGEEFSKLSIFASTLPKSFVFLAQVVAILPTWHPQNMLFFYLDLYSITIWFIYFKQFKFSNLMGPLNLITPTFVIFYLSF